MPLNFPHVPKVAGTYIGKSLSKNHKVFRDYDHPPETKRKFFIDRCNQRNADFIDLDFSKFDVIFGHFPIKRYNPDYPRIAFIRDPIDRIISHFNYWKYLIPETNLKAFAKNPIIREVKRGTVDVVDMAVDLKLNLQYQVYFERSAPESFAVAGFFDQMEIFSQRIHDNYNLNIDDSVSRFRENSTKDPVSKEERDKLARICKDDIDWYSRMRAHWCK